MQERGINTARVDVTKKRTTTTASRGKLPQSLRIQPTTPTSFDVFIVATKKDAVDCPYRYLTIICCIEEVCSCSCMNMNSSS